MSIAITGATGQLGRLVLERISTRLPSAEIVALARSPEKLDRHDHVTARRFDYDAPETLVPALEGVETLLLISSSEVGQRARQHQAVIDAAGKAGVRHIVYTSLLHADLSPIGLAAEHRTSEDALAASGISHTILRNGWYTENYAGSLHGALANGAIVGSAGTGRISAATRADYADAAIAVLADGSLRGKTYELAGDTAFTLAELAAELSRQSGRDIPYRDLPAQDYAGILEGAGLPETLAGAIADYDVKASQDALYDDSGTLSALIGRPTTPLATAVADILR